MPLQEIVHPKILIRSPNWVGDAVMATPVPRALKRTWPEARIHVLARAWAAPVWENHPDIEQILSLGKGLDAWARMARVIRDGRYDLALVLPNSFSAAWLAYWGRCRRRVGYATGLRSWLLTLHPAWTADEHPAPRPQTYLDLAQAAGADPARTQEWLFTLKVTPEELRRADSLLGTSDYAHWVGLAPGSVAPSRRWPAERYAQLADRLAALGMGVVLVGSAPDAAVAQAVARQAQSRPRVLAGQTDLRTGMAVIKRLSLLVTNDSGSMHLAYGLGVPVLALQGAADPNVTGPFGSASRVIRSLDVACAPCVRNECSRGLACMTAIALDEVAETAADMLANRMDRLHGH